MKKNKRASIIDRSTGPLVSTLLALVLMLWFYAAGVSFAVAIPLSLLFGLVGQQLVLLLIDRKEDTFGPIVFASAYFLINMAVRASYILVFSPDAKRLGRVMYDDYLAESLWCAALAYACLLIGFHCSASERLFKLLPPRQLEWPKAIPAARIATISTLGFLVIIFFFRHGAGVVGAGRNQDATASNGFLQLLLFQAIPFGWTVSLVYFWGDRQYGNRIKAAYLSILTLAFIVVSILISGSKQGFATPLVEALIVFHFLKSRLRLWQVGLVALPAIAIAFGAINFYRFVIVPQGGTPQNFSDIAKLASSAADGLQSGSDAGKGSAGEQLMNRQAGIDALALVMKLTPNPRPYSLGIPYWDAVVSAVVPRQLWRDKPVYDTSREFEQNFMGMPRFYEGHTSPQILSDLYQNFGVFGVAGGMFIFGMGLRLLYMFCSPGRSSLGGVLFYALLMPALAHLMEVSAGLVLIEFPRILLFAVVAAAVIGVRYTKLQNKPLQVFIAVADRAPGQVWAST